MPSWDDNTANLPDRESAIRSELAGVSGLPTGGSVGQVLAKNSSTDRDASWATVSSKAIYVSDYVVGDGVTDDTTAYQTAVNDAITKQVPFVGMWPGHTILLNGTVYIQPLSTTEFNHFFRFIGPYAGFQNPSNNPSDAGATKILCGNTTGPCLWFRGNSSSGGLSRVMIEGLKVWSAADRLGQPLIQLGDDVMFFQDFRIKDVFLDGRGFKGDGILLHTGLVGQMDNVIMQNMAQGIGWRFRNWQTENTGNLAWRDCRVIFTNPASKGGGAGWLLKEYYGANSGGLINSLSFDNCKTVAPTDSPNRYFNQFIPLVVSGTYSAGATTFNVVDATGVQPGQMITFSTNTNARVWCDWVSSVNSTTITLASGSLAGPLANNDAAIIGNWHTIVGNVTGITSNVPHWENTCGMLCSGVHGVQITEPLLGNYVPRGVYLVRGSTRVRVHGGQGASGVQVLDNSIYFHQANESVNARNHVADVNLTDLNWSGAVNPKVVQNDVVANPVGYRDTTSWTTV